MRAFLFLFILAPLAASKPFNERWYQDRVAELWKAKTEKTVANGRIDIVTDQHAVEVEFADKWKESIGQALWYSMQTNLKPGIILILKDKDDLQHAIRLKSVILNSKLEIKIWVVSENQGKIKLEEW